MRINDKRFSQGAMPSVFYAVPTFSLLGVYIYLSTAGLEAAARSRTGMWFNTKAILEVELSGND